MGVFCLLCNAFCGKPAAAHHLKNNIILPLARRHFMAGDMAGIGRDMATRRNIDFPA
jgi:hypothetical protein